jgi:hypothetical protein
MAKQSGFFVNVRYFVPIDKKDFAKQAAAYSTMAEIEKEGKLPADFAGDVIDVKVKQGSHGEAE